MSDKDEFNVDAHEVVEIFTKLDEAVGGHQIAAVAAALSIHFATCIIEAMEPGDDVDECIETAVGELRRLVRATIDGRGPIFISRRDKN